MIYYNVFLIGVVCMSESQFHGFKFEDYILKNKMKEIVEVVQSNIDYNNEWDFPPISVKSFKNESDSATIEFGSLERIYSNETSYILFLVGYKQEDNYKVPNFSDILFIKRKEMQFLKSKLTLEDIKKLTQELKSFRIGQHEEARKWAAIKKEEYNKLSYYDIRFKIDSKIQRRIQCALKLSDLYKYTANTFVNINKYDIPAIESGKRKRNK